MNRWSVGCVSMVGLRSCGWGGLGQGLVGLGGGMSV